MQININVKNIQHINDFQLELDASQHGLICIVGKNGVGKTTIIKCIRNLSISDTFAKTSSDNIFSTDSEITYDLGGDAYTFNYDTSTKALELKTPIPAALRSEIDVELPIPHGNRFNFFQSISNANDAIVKAIALRTYQTPEELIELLNSIYSTDKFNALIEVQEKGSSYYALLDGDEGRYIREDYLSSGEFFVISLYRKIKSQKKLIVIDELDISLDAAAQVLLVRKLREYCQTYSVNILFTTHSLALMRTLDDGELFYLRNISGKAEISQVSYNYIKSVLFGFEGWDKYILTEDETLQGYIEYLINKFCPEVFYRYKIIYVGGGENVVDLMERNIDSTFLSSPENVICILDGDQEGKRHVTRHDNVYCIPQQSVEKDLYASYMNNDDAIPRLTGHHSNLGTRAPDKSLYKKLVKGQLMPIKQVYDFVTNKHQSDVDDFVSCLQAFLRNPS
ncbi:ATP-dependent endonuclease [Vibrio sp. NTOU-M3]|uniref:ATP-dependent nuclease n=1 Tax=Vibrio sp. NTOU-M3 TaxID=3234954 RepID=UPI00349FAF80